MEMVNVECEEQEMKINNDEDLANSLTIQIIISSSYLRRLVMTFSDLMKQAMVSTIIRYFIFILFSFTVRVESQFCRGISQYDQCSLNSACACFYIAGAIDTGICTAIFTDCSKLVACKSPDNLCDEPNHRCIHHPLCHNRPVCYLVPSFNEQLCPPIAVVNTTTTIPTTTITTAAISTTTTKTIQQLVIPNIPVGARWAQNGTNVAGGHENGNATNQLNEPWGLFVDDDQTMVIADTWNHRIIQWTMNDKNGQVVAGGHGQGKQLDQLYWPSDVLIAKDTDSLIICDVGNQRVVRWSRRSGTTQGEILINNIDCFGLAMDDQRYLYISDTDKDEVRQYKIGDKNGTIVAGGNGRGAGLNQLNNPTNIFIDQQQTVYVSDYNNHRVMKWNKGAKEGIIVAGGQGQGNALTQLSSPQGLFVDTLSTIYVTDPGNNRVIRWPKGAQQGIVIVGGKGQLYYPIGLSFDRHGNLYVVDSWEHRVQRFSME
ncbi:unnamed protein product [Rotaria sordida]|uniref:Uncharacterized protein n=1 Tax=Rotaria sordida TaxID=392033 RepID=A0A815EIS9_9BILA|nr:unnamed protein product [Rotaria sordida]